MGDLATTDQGYDEVTLLKIAREVAKDILPIETILDLHKITPTQWETLQTSRIFLGLLQSEAEAWGSATNTAERLKLKALSMMEEWLPEANSRIHDRSETLAAKNETVKVVSRLAGIGANGEGAAGSGEKFSFTINLGNADKLRFEKEVTTKVIEGTTNNEYTQTQPA
jgi:hypothetical protein